MKNVIPFIDSTGKIHFPEGNEDTETEAQLEAQQTAARIELEQRIAARAVLSDWLTTLERRGIQPFIWCGELEDVLHKFDF